MAEFERLADGFPPAGEADWQRLAGNGAKGGMERLSWHSPDGLRVGPIYGSGAGPVIPMRLAGRPWRIVQRVTASDPAILATIVDFARQGGCAGVEFLFVPNSVANCRNTPSIPALDATLSGIAATLGRIDVPLWVDAGSETLRFARAAGSAGVINAVYDPLAALAFSTPPIDLDADFAGIADLIRTRETGVAVTADGRLWHNAGATEVQELGIALASAVASLRSLGSIGVAPGAAWRRLGVRLTADADQFLTIAKFRAARLLLARVAEVSGLAARPPIHAETSWRMLGAANR